MSYKEREQTREERIILKLNNRKKQLAFSSIPNCGRHWEVLDSHTKLWLKGKIDSPKQPRKRVLIGQKFAGDRSNLMSSASNLHSG